MQKANAHSSNVDKRDNNNNNNNNNSNDNDDSNNHHDVNEGIVNGSEDNVNVNTLGDVDEEEQDMLIDMNDAKENEDEAWGQSN